MPGPSGEVGATTQIAAGIVFGNLLRIALARPMPPADAPITTMLFVGTLNAVTLQPISKPPQSSLRSLFGGEDKCS